MTVKRTTPAKATTPIKPTPTVAPPATPTTTATTTTTTTSRTAHAAAIVPFAPSPHGLAQSTPTSRTNSASSVAARVAPIVAPDVRALVDAIVHEQRAVVVRHKDVAPSDSAGGGDNPAISERRAALGALLREALHHPRSAERDIAALRSISPQVSRDVDWVLAADVAEYKIDAAGQFHWSEEKETGFGTPADIDAAFQKRVALGRAAADGDGAFLKLHDDSLAPLAFAAGAGRIDMLADAVLQLRSPHQENAQRINIVGSATVAEHRAILDGRHLSADTRELALWRFAIRSHPLSSMNQLFHARNAVGTLVQNGCTWAKKEVAPGATDSAYKTIHNNYSSASAKNVELTVAHFVFTKGPEAARAGLFVELVDVLTLARTDRAAAERALAALSTLHPEALAGLGVGVDAIGAFLVGAATKPLGADPLANLALMAEVVRAVCKSRVTADALRPLLLGTTTSREPVARALLAAQGAKPAAAVQAIAHARAALAEEIHASTSGRARHDLLRLDGELDRLLLELLGGLVDDVGDIRSATQKRDALAGITAALRACHASGLAALMLDGDVAATRGPDIDALLARLDAACARSSSSSSSAASSSSSLDAATYRSLMAEAYAAARTLYQNMRTLFDARSAVIAADGSVEIDREFFDQLVKQTPIHYASALAQKGTRVGLESRIEPDLIENPAGLRILNSIGAVAFTSVVMATSSADLVALKPASDALCVILNLDQKRVMRVGGIVADVVDAPGGNSHLNMFAVNNGMPVIALPELRAGFLAFFTRAQAEGGIVIDEPGGSLRMMTLKRARAEGVVKSDADVEALKPGVNKLIRYHTIEGKTSEHLALLSKLRETRTVDLFVPPPANAPLSEYVMSFDALADLGLDGRYYAGEKGFVLAQMRAVPELRDDVPDGSVLAPQAVELLLKDAGIWDEWQAAFGGAASILDTRFYTDRDFRNATCARMEKLVDERLGEHLVDGRTGEPTQAGGALLAFLERNATLAGSASWIARSSFTGEDRPNKSGAGQYESYPRLDTAAARLKGIVGVIASAWLPEPVQSNVADQVDLRTILPAVVVQDCVAPDVSGVVTSRDPQTGARGTHAYQIVKGFGGGVEGGAAEEGIVSAGGPQLDRQFPGAPGPLASSQSMLELRKKVLRIEQLFDQVLEKGSGYAVDVEAARVDGRWKIVQARVFGG